MAEILDLKTGAREHDAKNVVDELEMLLASAKAGEIESFAIVTRTPDGTLRTRSTPSRDIHHLLAGVSYLQYDIIKGHSNA